MGRPVNDPFAFGRRDLTMSYRRLTPGARGLGCRISTPCTSTGPNSISSRPFACWNCCDHDPADPSAGRGSRTWPGSGPPVAQLSAERDSTIEPPDNGRPVPTVTVNFLGMTGPQGALPTHYTQLLLRIAREGRGTERTALRDWLDLFNHRLVGAVLPGVGEVPIPGAVPAVRDRPAGPRKQGQAEPSAGGAGPGPVHPQPVQPDRPGHAGVAAAAARATPHRRGPARGPRAAGPDRRPGPAPLRRPVRPQAAKRRRASRPSSATTSACRPGSSSSPANGSTWSRPVNPGCRTRPAASTANWA